MNNRQRVKIRVGFLPRVNLFVLYVHTCCVIKTTHSHDSVKFQTSPEILIFKRVLPKGSAAYRF